MKSLKDFIKNNKLHILLLIIALLIWGFTFLTDQKIFSSDPLSMMCFPINENAVPLMHLLSKALVLAILFGMLEFLSYGFKHKKLLISFCAFFALYILLLLCNYPGYYMSDDTVIFGYATRYYPVYWHNYLTSLYYMVAMSLFPASTGPIILNDLCMALVFSYLFYKADLHFKGKSKYLILLCGLMPFVLLSALMCFRPALYAPFFLFFFVYLYFEKRESKPLTIPKVLGLAFLVALLCFWRSEGIVLIIFSLILIPVCYGIHYKRMGLFLLIFALFFGIIKIPQSQGETLYYGSDYLIISTVRPLSLIIHREQTYEGALEDLANIDKIVDLDYMSYETLSCSSYNRYNSDFNAGRFSQTGADTNTQKAYLKSAFRLIVHNLDLYLAERLQLFLVTNGIYDYNPSLVMGLKPVETVDFHLYQSDKAYGYELIQGNKRLPLNSHNQLALTLFSFGGEAYLPILVLLFVTLIYTGIRKKGFAFWTLLSLLTREAVIFMTAPASFIQYSYPVMFVTICIVLLLILEKVNGNSVKPSDIA